MRTLCGKRILLTGATGTLGAVAALALVQEGAELILPVRNARKADMLKEHLLSQVPHACLSFPLLDLACEDSVCGLARELLTQGKHLDGIIHNAGLFTRSGRTAPSGEELHMQVNCLSPCKLTEMLLPLLRPSGSSFVLTVTSLSAFWKKTNAPGSATELYAASKRALLDRHAALAADCPEIAFIYAHPGVCATGLFLNEPKESAYSQTFLRFALPVMKCIFPTPEKACRSITHAVLHAENGQLAEPRGLFHIWGKPALVPLSKRLKTYRVL